MPNIAYDMDTWHWNNLFWDGLCIINPIATLILGIRGCFLFGLLILSKRRFGPSVRVCLAIQESLWIMPKFGLARGICFEVRLNNNPVTPRNSIWGQSLSFPHHPKTLWCTEISHIKQESFSNQLLNIDFKHYSLGHVLRQSSFFRKSSFNNSPWYSRCWGTSYLTFLQVRKSPQLDAWWSYVVWACS